MLTPIKDFKPGQYVQVANPDHILRVENSIKTPYGQSMHFSLHGVLTDFAEYNPLDSLVVVTLH